MKPINAMLEELVNNIEYSDRINPTISTSTVGWHIDHCILVINQIIGSVKQSDPAQYVWRFNFKKWVVFTLNKIPRGKARAPKAVMPEVDFKEEVFMINLATAKKNVELLNDLPPNHFFVHPFFGKLNVRATKKMILLHTDHHLKIIGDILKVV